MDDFVNPFRQNVVEDENGQALASQKHFIKPKRRLLLTFGIAFTIMLCGLAIGARPAYRGIKRWRAQKLIAQAEQSIAQEEWRAAFSSLQAAFVLSPTDEPLRAMAKLLTQLGSDQALEYWERVIVINPTILSDRRALIEAALKFETYELAEVHADALLRTNSPSKKDMLLAASVARARRDSDKEIQLLRNAEARWPEDALIQFLIQRLIIQSGGSKEEIARATETILTDIYRKDEVGLEALNFVSHFSASIFPDRLQLSVLLRNHPLSGTIQEMTACSLEIEVYPFLRDAKIDELVEATQGKDPKAVATLAGWLLKLKEFKQILKLIPFEAIKKNPFQSQIRLDALSLLGSSELLAQELADPEVIISEEFRAFYRWQAALRGGINTPSERDLREAIEKAAFNPGALAFFAVRFEEFGREDLAIQVYTRLQSRVAYSRTALIGLLRIARSKGDTNVFLRVLEQSSVAKTRDPMMQADVAYVKLLLSHDIEESLAISTDLVKSYPNKVLMRTSYALACLRSGDGLAALKTFDEIDFSWQRASDSARVVYVAALLANRRDSEAAPIVRILSNSVLFPEERVLIKKLP